jgi:predicted Zn-dependent peptidase
VSPILTPLNNGLRVLTDPMENVETVSLGVWVEAGTRNEPAALNGVSHVLEHMAFKGTERRSARAIAEEIEAVGGYINAHTSREHTAYYIKVLKEDLGLAVDIIADILQNSRFDEAELNREREVIIQEINHADDTPDDIIFDRFQLTAFPDQPVGRPVLGSAAGVRDMPRAGLIDYMTAHYRAPRMIVAGAGRLDHERLARLSADAFGGVQGGSASTFEPARYNGGDWREERDIEQAHIVLGFQGIAYNDPDFYAASVFSTLFGGGMSSRLFQEIRESRGLAYSVYSFMSCYLDGGLFGIYAGTGEKEAAGLTPLLLDEILKVRDGVTEEELGRARAQLKASILMSLESTYSRAEQMARHLMIFGRLIPTQEIIDAVDGVDAEAVKRVARRLTSGKPTLAALGPVGSVMPYDGIEKRLA